MCQIDLDRAGHVWTGQCMMDMLVIGMILFDSSGAHVDFLSAISSRVLAASCLLPLASCPQFGQSLTVRDFLQVLNPLYKAVQILYISRALVEFFRDIYQPQRILGIVCGTDL